MVETVKYGSRIVGMVPVSDAFGVDLIVDQYRMALKKSEEQDM